MLSFIRKRFPSKDRTIQHEYQNNQMRKSQSAYELNLDNKIKVKNKKKERPSSPSSSQMNQSYSDIDYFPMMSTNHHQTTNDHSDFYLNPSETVQTINQMNYVTIPIGKARQHPISVSSRSNDQQIPNYKDVDHQRTKALTQTIQQRTQQKSFH